MIAERPCTAATIAGRPARAVEFFDSAEDGRREHRERVNAWLTLYILAGIAAADVICFRALGGMRRGRTTSRQ